MKDLFLKSQQDFLFGNLSQLDLGKFNEVLETLETQQMREEQVGRLLSTFQNNVLILNFGSSSLLYFLGRNHYFRCHSDNTVNARGTMILINTTFLHYKFRF